VSKFEPLAAYDAASDGQYQLLPLKFTPLDSERYVLTNMVGEYAVVPRATVHSLARHSLRRSDPHYLELKAKHFLRDADSHVAVDLLALKARTKYQRLTNFTGLHMFVVSLRCEHSCPYCQVSRQSDDRVAFDMTEATATKALDLVFRSPSPTLKIEFQGGESLLNFPLIKFIVGKALEKNHEAKRDLQFVIATNLAVVTDEMLDFCKEHGVLLSTSLDGPADLHNANRPRPGRDSYERAIAGIKRAREVLGHDGVSALMTTTRASLGRVRDIIDEYVAQGFNNIFLRSLSPYGFAIKTKTYAAYDTNEWLSFYFEGLHYIIELNKKGIPFVEAYAATILSKMLTPFETGYVDLMNPAGIGIAAVVYNYDGDVYASDEGRMLAEMNDKTFCMGNLHLHSYEELFGSDALMTPLEETFTSSVPMCSNCAFEPYCGADPVYHHATQGDFVGRKPLSGFCEKNMAIFRTLIGMMEEDHDTKRLFRRWAAHS
jgi:His-Xaa-Ser system radical SAM maturase HxsB